MDCPTCEQLTAELELLETRYAKARSYMEDIAATAAADHYSTARLHTEATRLDCEVARIKLERHQLAHSAQQIPAKN